MFNKLNSQLRSFEKDRKYQLLILAIATLLPLLFTLHSVFSGAINFWFDPARDLLLALDNLQKPTFLGQPSGIPNVFYGPYWIWTLSAFQIFTKDPRFITFFVLTIPYFVIFPFILFKFSKVFGRGTTIALWFLFILGFSQYAGGLWNPYPAPLLFLILVYLILFKESFAKLKLFRFLAIGAVVGLIMNFSLSFGIGICLGVILYLIIEAIIEPKIPYVKIFKKLVLFMIGLTVVFLPTIFFEYRHGFYQTQALFYALTQSFLHNSAVVGQVGLREDGITLQFLDVINKVLELPVTLTFILFIFLFVYLVKFLKKNKLQFKDLEQRLLLMLTSIIISILFVYLSTKNPVWEYHFIGVEIIFLLLIGVLVNKLPRLKNLLIIWSLALLLIHTVSFVGGLSHSPLQASNLASKENISRFIYADSNNKPFSYSVYSSAIYTYDYDYLFKWLGTDRNYTPDSTNSTPQIYVIAPPEVHDDQREGLVKFKTPDDKYKTAWEKMFPDGTFVVKRVKK